MRDAKGTKIDKGQNVRTIEGANKPGKEAMVIGLNKGWVRLHDKEGEEWSERPKHLVVSVRLNPDRERYVRGLGITPSGCDTLDINDRVAEMLRGLKRGELIQLAARWMAQNPEHVSRVWKKRLKGAQTEADVAHRVAAFYDGRNNGMVRMNVGNLLRGILNRKEKANGEA